MSDLERLVDQLDRLEGCLLALFHKIDHGTEGVWAERFSWNTIGHGNVVFRTSTGWEVVVFNDSGAWDYLESVTTPEGVKFGYEILSRIESLRNYEGGARWTEARVK
mgnify:CR=1 FL=1